MATPWGLYFLLHSCLCDMVERTKVRGHLTPRPAPCLSEAKVELAPGPLPFAAQDATQAPKGCAGVEPGQVPAQDPFLSPDGVRAAYSLPCFPAWPSFHQTDRLTTGWSGRT